MGSNFSNSQLAQEIIAIDVYFGALGKLGHHEAYLDLGVILVSISDVSNMEPEFGQTNFSLEALCPFNAKHYLHANVGPPLSLIHI